MFFFVFFCWILICFEMQNTLILILLDHSHDAYARIHIQQSHMLIAKHGSCISYAALVCVCGL